MASVHKKGCSGGQTNFDLAKAEAKLKEYKGGGIAKARRPFRELMESLPAGSSAWSKEKLLEVVR